MVSVFTSQLKIGLCSNGDLYNDLTMIKILSWRLLFLSAWSQQQPPKRIHTEAAAGRKLGQNPVYLSGNMLEALCPISRSKVEILKWIKLLNHYVLSSWISLHHWIFCLKPRSGSLRMQFCAILDVIKM